MPSINAIADKLTPSAQRALLAAMRKMAQHVSIPALTTAIEQGNIGAALTAVKAVQFPIHLKPFSGVIENVFQQAATETMKPFVVVDSTFTKKNPLAQAAADWSAQKVTLITEETRTAIRQLVRKGLTEGIEPKRLAKEIKPLVGLNARQAIAVQNAKAAWLKAGLDAATVDAKGLKYTEKLRKYRALMIARTETIGSSNRGQLHAWRAGAKAGLLDPNITKRKWIATPTSARTCPICQKMHGQIIEGLQAFFVVPGGKQVQHPPVHPNCRCTVALIVPLAEGKKLPSQFNTPPPVPEAVAPPMPVMPEATDYEKQAAEQQAALDAAAAAKKAAIKAKHKEYAARHRAKKKAEREAAKLAAKMNQPQDVLDIREYEAADAALNVAFGEERIDAKRTIMHQLSERLAGSQAKFGPSYAKRTLASMSKDERDRWCSDRVSLWAGTSGDSDHDAVAMQLAVRDVFDLHATADMSHFPPQTMRAAQELYEANGEAYREFVRVMHNNTQEWFEQKGITHVTLVRGARYTGSNKPKEGWGVMKLQPASSFSTHIETSQSFGDTMHLTRVPVQDIIGTARSGYGCLSEHEFVVLARNQRAYTSHQSGADPMTGKFPISKSWNWGDEIRAILRKGTLP